MIPVNPSFDVLSNPAVIRLGIGTPLVETRSTFKSLNQIGHSYAGGPIFKIASYELSEFDILGAEVAFNRNDCLDALYLEFEKVHYAHLFEHLRKVFTPVSEHDNIQDNSLAVFGNGPIEITLDSQKPGSSCFVSYTSQAFKHARETYSATINNNNPLPCSSSIL